MDRFREDEAIQVFISTDAGGTGLNLQSASVLINLDMPWNPAVLDQRIARIHRLGQTRTVQIILMVAEDSYEERVLALAQGKRELFTNVISPEASEDVVGVSRKLLETLAEDLVKPAGPLQPAAAEEPPPVPAASGLPDEPSQARETPAADPAIARCIADIQSAFGPRIERILGSRGGLLVVMDPIDAQADRIAQGLSETVPVALIDPRTFIGLKRLGAASPLGETRTFFELDQGSTRPGGPALLRLAREKLRAAETLIGQGCLSTAGELLTSAMLSAAAARGGLSQPPIPQEAAVWIYSEALPKGILTPEQATALLRASALSQAPSMPRSLLDQVLEDARRLIDQAA